jgi:hypothetical protein
MEKRICKYDIIFNVDGDNYPVFVQKVQAALDSGWQPYGNFFSTHDKDVGEFFYQPVVKYEE